MAKTRPKIARGTGVQSAFLSIREMIVYGRLAPGSWLVEGDLAEKLRVSRTPIRHALQWLEHEGYVVAVGAGPKSRMTVAPLTEKDARETYRLVGYMEGMSGRLVAGLSSADRQALVKDLKELNALLSKISKKPDFDAKEFFEVDTTFHARIVEATAGPRTLAIYNGIKPHTERYWWLYASSIHHEQAASIREHAKIISAIRAGDQDAVESALLANWENGAARLIELIRKFGERGQW